MCLMDLNTFYYFDTISTLTSLEYKWAASSIKYVRSYLIMPKCHHFKQCPQIAWLSVNYWINIFFICENYQFWLIMLSIIFVASLESGLQSLNLMTVTMNFSVKLFLVEWFKRKQFLQMVCNHFAALKIVKNKDINLSNLIVEYRVIKI